VSPKVRLYGCRLVLVSVWGSAIDCVLCVGSHGDKWPVCALTSALVCAFVLCNVIQITTTFITVTYICGVTVDV